MSALQFILVTGLSGSGKSIALSALEDAGFFSVDNLPPELLEAFIALPQVQGGQKIAVAIDARSKASVPTLPHSLENLSKKGVEITCIFLDASNDVLTRRFSETRRSHPLSRSEDSSVSKTLIECIQQERTLMRELRDQSVVIDTTLMRPANLSTQVKKIANCGTSGIHVFFESFAFKKGIPQDADFIFDVRTLPNPHYDLKLRNLDGRDAPVRSFLREQAEVSEMIKDIANFLRKWLPTFRDDHRTYVTIGIGCTGGQHRSVYIAEELSSQFSKPWNAQTRHRDL